MAKTSDRRGEREGTAPADAFALLSNEVRIDVLRALFRTDDPQSYADLREAVAYGGSGNFNYHLRKLVGQFVRKTDEGYVLAPAGDRVIRMVVAETLTGGGRGETASREFPCVLCGGVESAPPDLAAATAGCVNCGGASPAAASGSRSGTRTRSERSGTRQRDERLPPADDRAVVYGSQLAAVLKDVCPTCRGDTSVTLDPCPDHDDGADQCGTCGTWFAAWARGECDRCSFGLRFPAAAAALYDPAVVAALADQGVDAPVPFLPDLGTHRVDGREIDDAVVATDPHRVAVTLPLDDGALTVRLDETLGVRSIEQSDSDTV